MTVGDGDLSFSLALCNWFRSQPDSKALACHLTKSTDSFHRLAGGLKRPPRWPANTNIDLVASVYDTRQEMNEKYEEGPAAETARKLAEHGAKVYYGVDATKLDT